MPLEVYSDVSASAVPALDARQLANEAEADAEACLRKLLISLSHEVSSTLVASPHLHHNAFSFPLYSFKKPRKNRGSERVQKCMKLCTQACILISFSSLLMQQVKNSGSELLQVIALQDCVCRHGHNCANPQSTGACA